MKRRLSITDDSIRVYSRRGNFHSEPDRAAAAGMTGLVAQGTQVCAPAVAILLDAWGDDFLVHGELDLRFTGMVLGGHDVEADVDVHDDGTATFTVTNLTTGAVAARGSARRRIAPRMRVSGPVLDTDDVPSLTRFYERLLGWAVVELEGPRPGYPEGDGWSRLRAPDAGMKIEIQYESQYVRPVWPPVAGAPQMMMHLDVLTPDLDRGVDWAVELGATVAPAQPQRPGDHVILLDPSGHPFCMCRDAG